MSARPLASVVIIFWNAGQFLREAIESVFAQTCTAWELILVDDGSTDTSPGIAQEYAGHYPERVHLVSHEQHVNRGMSASRNLGVRHAQGEYVAFLDADDVWSPGTLEEQIAILEQYPHVALVYGTIQYWYSWTGKPEDRERDYIERLGVPSNTVVKPPTLLPLFLRDQAAVPSGLLARRQVIKRIGGFEDAFRGEYEDQVFCAKVCLHEPVFAADRCWYRYRQHANSCVSIGLRTGESNSAREFFLNWLVKYLSEQKETDLHVWLAVHSELARYRYPRAFRRLQRGKLRIKQIRQSLRLLLRGKLVVTKQSPSPSRGLFSGKGQSSQ